MSMDSFANRALAPQELKLLSEYFDSRHEAIIDLIRRFVEIETPTNDVAGSKRIVDLITQTARKIDANLEVEQFVAADVGTHLRLRFRAVQANRKPTLVVGHTDTVHALGSLAARPARIANNKLYAPGAFDMKANWAISLEAVRALRELKINLARDIVFLLTCDEETGSSTSRNLIEQTALSAAQALVIEPSGANGAAKTARKGTGTWTIEARGIASHAGLNPSAGASAILEVARQTARLHDINLHADNNSSNGIHFNVGVIDGGTRSNVVAALAHVEVDARFATMAEAAQVEKMFQTLAPFDARVQLGIAGGINRPPLERTKEVVKLYTYARELAAAIGFELGEVSVGGASDGNFIGALNVPVLDGLGLRGGGAHADDEHIELDDITARSTLLAALFATL